MDGEYPPPDPTRRSIGSADLLSTIGTIAQTISYSDHLDLNRLSIEEVEEFVPAQQDEQTSQVWASLKQTWGV